MFWCLAHPEIVCRSMRLPLYPFDIPGGQDVQDGQFDLTVFRKDGDWFSLKMQTISDQQGWIGKLSDAGNQVVPCFRKVRKDFLKVLFSELRSVRRLIRFPLMNFKYFAELTRNYDGVLNDDEIVAIFQMIGCTIQPCGGFSVTPRKGPQARKVIGYTLCYFR